MPLEGKWLLLELFLRGIRKMSTIKMGTPATTEGATFALSLGLKTGLGKNEFNRRREKQIKKGWSIWS